MRAPTSHDRLDALRAELARAYLAEVFDHEEVKRINLDILGELARLRTASSGSVENSETKMTDHDALYHAVQSPFGLIVSGNATSLRKARSELRDDIALLDLAVLGPDEKGNVWLVRQDALRSHLIRED